MRSLVGMCHVSTQGWLGPKDTGQHEFVAWRQWKGDQAKARLLLGAQLEPDDLRQKVPALARSGPATIHLDKRNSKLRILFG